MTSQEYTVRAASGDRKLQKILLAKFPSKVPNLRTGDWSLKEEAQDGGGQRWTLEDSNEGPTFNGAPEVGLAGAAPSNYFVLFRDKGDFMAVPVEKWATFRQTQHRAELSLEDAEAQMKHQRLQADKANPRLAQAIGTDAEEEAPLPGDQQRAAGEEDADSDDEWKDIKARAASIAAVTAGSTQPSKRSRNTTGGDDDDAEAGGPGGVNPEALYVPRPRDAEDWEHETEAADDDLDMGDGSEGEVEVSPARRPEVSDSDGEGDIDASKVKRTIRKMLRATGLEESDEEGSEERSEGPSGDDDEDEDEDDLDKMASEVLTQQTTTTGGGGGGGGSVAGGEVRKRKSPPPSSEAARAAAAAPAAVHAAVPAGTGTGGGGEQGAAKKARVQSPPPNLTAPGALSDTGAGANAAGGEFPTAAEVVALLQTHGRLRLKDLIQAFKTRLKNLEERRKFSDIVKGVAKLDPIPSAEGQKYLVLK